MKSYKFYNTSKKIAIGFVAFAVAFAIESCHRKIHFLTSPTVPAARGYIKVKRDKNNNYVIYASISNLAEVKRLTPPRESYVIWLVSSDNTYRNIGKIQSSTGSFSSKLSASFETVSAFKPSKIFITAEDNTSTLMPSETLILSTDNF